MTALHRASVVPSEGADAERGNTQQAQLEVITNVPTVISKRVESCLRLLERWKLSKDSGTRADGALSLLRLWAMNNFVFASDHKSLDWRLRHVEVLSSVITDLLDELQSSVLMVIDLERTEQAETRTANKVSTELETLGNIQAQLFEICRGIHCSGVLSKVSKLAHYQHILRIEEKEVDLTETFRKDTGDFVDACYRKASETVRLRLADSISLRRQNFLYLRDREAEVRGESAREKYTEKGQRPVNEHTEDQGPTTPAMPNSSDLGSSHADEGKATKPQPPSSIFSTSTTEPNMAMGSPSVRSSSTFVASSNPSISRMIPPSPTKTGSGYIKCPYCFLICREEEMRDESWKRHFLRDLMPYVCLLEDCKTPDVLFDSFKCWSDHMISQHPIATWVCNNRTHRQPYRFETSAACGDHMMTQHANEFDKADLSEIVEASELSQPRTDPLTWCPICGDDFDAGLKPPDDILRHVAEHLVHLAFRSVPQGDEEEDVKLEKESDPGLLSSISEPANVPQISATDETFLSLDQGRILAEEKRATTPHIPEICVDDIVIPCASKLERLSHVDPVSVTAAATAIIGQSIQLIRRVTRAIELNKNGNQSLGNFFNDLRSTVATIELVQTLEPLRTKGVLKALTTMHKHAQQLDKHISSVLGISNTESFPRRMAHQFTSGPEELESTNKMIAELITLKATLILQIQVAHVGLSVEKGPGGQEDSTCTHVLNSHLLHYVNHIVEGRLGKGKGLKIAEVLQGKEPDDDGMIRLTKGEYESLAFHPSGTIPVANNKTISQTLETNGFLDDSWEEFTHNLTIEHNVAQEPKVRIKTPIDEGTLKKMSPSKRERTPQPTQTYACPLYLQNRGRHMPCRNHALKTWDRVLQHLKRAHLAKEGYCPKCRCSLSNEILRDEHRRLDNCQPAHIEQSGVLLPEDYNHLKRLGRGSDETKWNEAWQRLFPHLPTPYPFYESDAEFIARTGQSACIKAFQKAAQGHDNLSALADELLHELTRSLVPATREGDINTPAAEGSQIADPAHNRIFSSPDILDHMKRVTHRAARFRDLPEARPVMGSPQVLPDTRLPSQGQVFAQPQQIVPDLFGVEQSNPEAFQGWLPMQNSYDMTSHLPQALLLSQPSFVSPANLHNDLDNDCAPSVSDEEMISGE